MSSRTPDARARSADRAHPALAARPLLATTVVALAATALNLLQACSFTPPSSLETPEDVYAIIDAAPYVEATFRDRWVVVDEPGKLHVQHGQSCASATEAASETYVGMRIGESVRLPAGYVGTVYQNGYDLRYDSKDHEVVGLGAAIYNVHLLNDILFWDAGGVISDHNGDDDYRWCYAYTVVAWPKPASGRFGLPIVPLGPYLDIEAVHADRHAALIFTDKQVGSVHAIRGKYTSPGKPPRAVLPTGFASAFSNDEHHLLQFGFDLGTPTFRGKRARWRSTVVLKDNDVRSFRSAELVSVLRGQSVRQFQPQHARIESGHGSPATVVNDIKLKARDDRSCGAVVGTPPVKQRTMAVTTPPYRWAMPMLTGWDLAEICDDEHKRRVGVWISDFSYSRAPGESVGTLRYTISSTFVDKEPLGFVDALQIDVLGFDMVEPVLAPVPVAF
jgi:hypothetical protein